MSMLQIGGVLNLDVVNCPVTGPEHHLLMILADYAHDDGSGCFPSIDTLTRKSFQNKKTVKQSLRTLSGKNSKWPDRQALIIISKGQGRRTSNYTLTLPIEAVNSWLVSHPKYAKKLNLKKEASSKIHKNHMDQLVDEKIEEVDEKLEKKGGKQPCKITI